MEEYYKKAYQSYVDEWGLDAQLLMAIEEMSELTKEICKYMRYNSFESDNKEKLEKTIAQLKSEIADVLNTTEQLQYCFGIEEIEKIRKEKIERTNKLLKGKE